MAETLRKGNLLIQQRKFTKTWRTVYCAVYGRSPMGVPRLEIYKKESYFWRSKHATTFLLADCVCIRELGPQTGSGIYQLLLVLDDSKRGVRLGFHTPQNCYKWKTAISTAAFGLAMAAPVISSPIIPDVPPPPSAKTASIFPAPKGFLFADSDENDGYYDPWDIQDIRVAVVETPTSQKLGLRGNYDVTVTSQGLLLKLGQKIFRVLQLGQLQRVGIGKECFFIETLREVIEFRSIRAYNLVERLRPYIPLTREMKPVAELTRHLHEPLELAYLECFRVLKSSYLSDERASVLSFGTTLTSDGGFNEDTRPKLTPGAVREQHSQNQNTAGFSNYISGSLSTLGTGTKRSKQKGRQRRSISRRSLVSEFSESTNKLKRLFKRRSLSDDELASTENDGTSRFERLKHWIESKRVPMDPGSEADSGDWEVPPEPTSRGNTLEREPSRLGVVKQLRVASPPSHTRYGGLAPNHYHYTPSTYQVSARIPAVSKAYASNGPPADFDVNRVVTRLASNRNTQYSANNNYNSTVRPQYRRGADFSTTV